MGLVGGVGEIAEDCWTALSAATAGCGGGSRFRRGVESHVQ